MTDETPLARSRPDDPPRTPRQTLPDGRPHWDGDKRELWFGDILLKRFRVPAENQIRILAIFQELGWPPAIDDPLRFDPLVNAKARLHTTIGRLNRSQITPVLHFSGDGSGERVLWSVRGSAGISRPSIDTRSTPE